MEKNEARERLAKLRDEFTSTVNTIKERLADPERPAIKVVVPGRLIIRESTVGKG